MAASTTLSPEGTDLDEALDRFIVEMPKVELHVHLEGTVLPHRLADLSARHGLEFPAQSGADPAQTYRFRDFLHFIELWVAINECLREPEDFAQIVVDLGAEAARQNIRYLEVFFSPEPHVRRKRLPFAQLLAGMNRGREEVRRRWGIELRWIADGVRDADSGPVSVTRTVEWITALDPSEGVIGLGLGGYEIGNPPGPFAAEFAAARAAGLHVVAHAGETDGPETIWESIRALKAERIGHGVRAIEDAELVAFLAANRIPLEISPTSNVCIGVFPTVADHPFRRLDEAGVLVTVNSDDPPLFGTTLTDEYRLLAREFGYGAADLERISLNAVRASFLPDADKELLLAEMAAESAALRARLGLE